MKKAKRSQFEGKAPLQTAAIAAAESMLQAQLTTAIAADARAVSVSGMLAAAAAILVGAAGTLLLGHTTWVHQLLGWTSLWVGAFLMVAMWFAIEAALPQPFDVAGNAPDGFKEELKSSAPLMLLRAEILRMYNDRIYRNKRSMKKNGETFKVAVNLARWSLAIGGGAALVTLTLYACQPSVSDLALSLDASVFEAAQVPSWP